MDAASLPVRLLRVVADEAGLPFLHPRLALAGAFAAALPYLTGKRLRALAYRAAGIRIGPSTIIYGRLHLWGGGDIAGRLTIGARCRLNTPCRLELSDTITLGDGVVLGHGVTLFTGGHEIEGPHCRAGRLRPAPIVIGAGAWIGTGVTVLPGVTVGAGAVVGAGALVTRDVPPHAVVGGVPARVLRFLPPDVY